MNPINNYNIPFFRESKKMDLANNLANQDSEEIKDIKKHDIILERLLKEKEVGPNSIPTVQNLIHELSHENHVSEAYINKVMEVVSHIFSKTGDISLITESVRVFTKYFGGQEDIYIGLKHAKENDSPLALRHFLRIIELNLGSHVELKDEKLFVIIKDLKASFEVISITLEQLSPIFKGHAYIDFKPVVPLEKSDVESFLKQNGQFIHSIRLTPLNYEIEDSFFKFLAKTCPNLESLTIHSKKIKGSELNFLKQLAKLKSLEFIWCLNLEVPKNFQLPKSLETLEINNSHKLIDFKADLPNLKRLELSYCHMIKDLSTIYLSNRIEKIILDFSWNIQTLPVGDYDLNKLKKFSALGCSKLGS